MNLIEHNYNTLLVSKSEKFNGTILPILKNHKCTNISLCSDTASARRKIIESSYDIVLINTPLPDEFGTKMALDFIANSSLGIMIFVKSEHFDEINSRLSPYGIFVISKPTSISTVSQSLFLLLATRERLKRMEQKTISIEEKMAEIRLINRAKWLLIENYSMTEPDAHRYIEKTAMDKCKTKKEIAETIINEFK